MRRRRAIITFRQEVGSRHADGKSDTLKFNSTDALAAGTYNVTVAVATRTPEDEPGEGGAFSLSIVKE